MKHKDERYLAIASGKRARRRGNWAIRHHGLPTFAEFMEQLNTLFDDLGAYIQMAHELIRTHVHEIKTQTGRTHETK
jgi:hypothetical protein